MEVSGDYDGQSLITFGHSKGHRPDLKQFMLYLVTTQDGDLPLLQKTVAGNSSDKTLFRQQLKELK